MNDELAADLQRWKSTFRRELSRHLSRLTQDSDIYGFALEMSDDLAELHFITCVGRESNLVGEKPGSAVWLDRRYSHVEWDGYDPQAEFDDSLKQLNEISNTYDDLFIDAETSGYTEAGTSFLNQLFAATLDVMAECDQGGEFGNIWFKVITFSDSEHPIQRESFRRLNRGRALTEAAALFEEE